MPSYANMFQIDRDFEKTYPDRAANLFLNWEVTFTKVLTLRKNTLNESDKLVLDILSCENLDLGMLFICFILLGIFKYSPSTE